MLGKLALNEFKIPWKQQKIREESSIKYKIANYLFDIFFYFKTPQDTNGVVLVTLLLTLNIFHTML